MRASSSRQRQHEGEPTQTPLPQNAKGGPPAVVVLALLSLIVVAATLFAHWPALSAQAQSFDDEEAIIQNRLVQSPSWNSVGRFFGEVALSSVVRGYYRPLTLTSLMLDWAMGGRPENFRTFHRTSLALHVGSTVLVILLGYQVFRQPILAALVGLLFGVHPLTVEPVAWVMERKTILAAFFTFACLNAYLRYTRHSRPQWLAAAVVLYLLSLLAKPTGTPLPIIMLLMDYWPLKRFSRRAVLEKVPFFILSAVFAALCVLCEQKVNPLSLPAKLSPLHLPLRLCWLTVFYPCKILLPIHLSSVYMPPQPLALSNMLVLLSVAGTIALIGFLIVSRRWTPAWWAGAAMFYVGLAPTMGFVGYSWVVASDKYVYLPAVGLVLVLGWLLERVWQGGPDAAAARRRRAAAVAVVLAAAGLLADGTRRYLVHWQTTEALYDYMLNLAPNAYQLYNNRGKACIDKGDYEQAMRDCNKTLEIKPDSAPAYNNRGAAYGGMGDYDQAIRDLSKAIELKNDYAEAYSNRANAYNNKGEFAQAIRDCTKALELKPEFAMAYNNRGIAYYAMGDFGQAIRDFSRAIESRPDYAEAYQNRAVAYYSLKQFDNTWADVKKCRQLGGTPNPDFVKALIEATGRTE